MSGLTDLRTWLGLYLNRTEQSTQISDLLINAGHDRLLRRHRWRGQEAHAAITYAPTDDGKALPSDFVEELVLSYNSADTDPSKALTPVPKLAGGRVYWLMSRSPRSLRDQAYPQVAALVNELGSTWFYYLWEEKIYVVPNPSASSNFQLDYYKSLPPLVQTTNEDDWFTTNVKYVLLWAAIVEGWHFYHEIQRAAAAEIMFERVLLAAIKHDESIAMSGPPRSRGT